MPPTTRWTQMWRSCCNPGTGPCCSAEPRPDGSKGCSTPRPCEAGSPWRWSIRTRPADPPRPGGCSSAASSWSSPPTGSVDVIGAIWALDTISSGDSGSSPWAVGPVVAGGMLLAAWAHRQVDRHGQDAHPRILAAGVAMALAQAVAGTATMTRTRASNGMQRHPYLAGVDMMGVLVSLYADEFSVLLAAGVGAGVVATIGLGVLLMPEPVDWAHLVCDLLWSAAAALAISGLRSGLDEDADRINAELARVDDANVNRAFADGRASVVSMVADAARRARRAFDASKGAMNPTVSTEVEHRFDEIRNRLIDLERDTGPACS